MRDKGCIRMNFAEALLLGFIFLKLCGVITWSWWWVLSPLLIPLILAIIVVPVVIFYRVYKGVDLWT